jgi:hypothetical protein
MEDDESVRVLGLAVPAERGWRLVRTDVKYEAKDLPATLLRDRVASFLRGISQSVLSAPAVIGEFNLTEVTITAEVTASGTVNLLGTGIETGGSGGITFTFTRPQPANQAPAEGALHGASEEPPTEFHESR